MTAKHDPMVGRYVYIDLEGRPYRVYYEENGTGIPLVLLHTAGSSGQLWRHQLADPDITDCFRAVALDMPRHGKSLPPSGFQAEEYLLTADFYSGFVKAFCDALELERPVVLGASIGGSICLELAHRYPGYFRAFISYAGLLSDPGWFNDVMYDPRIHSEVQGNAVIGMMAPQSPDANRWEIWWLFAQCGPGVFRGDLYYNSLDHDMWAVAGEIGGDTPIFFLAGDYDYAYSPERVKATAMKIAGAETVAMKAVGHFGMAENPPEFKRYLLPLLYRIRSESGFQNTRPTWPVADSALIPGRKDEE